MKAKVARRTLEARLKRHLEKEGIALRKCRVDSKWHADLGDYYTVNVQINAVDEKHIDLEVLSRNSGVLKPFEELEQE